VKTTPSSEQRVAVITALAANVAVAIAKFAAESSRIVNTAEFREKYLNNLGFEPAGDTPEQFAAFLKQDRALAEKKVKASGAKLD